MKFGPLPVRDAEGAILAHSVRGDGFALKKGRVLTRADIEALTGTGIEEVLTARLEPGDVHEDEAARRLAVALAGGGARAAAPFTGRANLVAEAAGLILVERELIDEINRIDEAMTVATLPPFTRVEPRTFLATVKIIPFAVSEASLTRAETLLAKAPRAVSVASFKPMTVAYVTSAGVQDKAVRLSEERLARLGSSLIGAPIAAEGHAQGPIQTAIKEALARKPDLVFVQGRSATVDRRDVVPAAIAAAGGEIRHFGMPVDPGNLLVLGRIGGTRIIVLPGCARSPKENGFDWVLERLAAGLDVTREDIQAMGVGGLLKETGSRPQPRAAAAAGRRPRIAGLLLAAGLSRRMGANKLLAPLAGKPLVRHAAEALTAAPFDRRIVIVGHQGDEVADALKGLAVEIIHAPRYAEGMSRSLRAGIQALGDTADAVIVMLGDMPALKARHLERLIAAYDPEEGRTICIPTFEGKRGNPVLFGRMHFEELMDVEGDIGGRAVIEANRDEVAEVAMPDEAIFMDVDTPEALKALK